MWKLFYMREGRECESKVGRKVKKTDIGWIKDCHYQVTQHGKRASLYTHWFVMSIVFAKHQWTWLVRLMCDMDSNWA